MTRRFGSTAVGAAWLACAGSAAGQATAADAGRGQLVRTADPAKRGLTAADFPRVTKLAEGVYTYGTRRLSGAETFTTVSLFVVSPDGILVADGQGSVAETKRMLDEIGKIAPQPITHVVVGWTMAITRPATRHFRRRRRCTCIPRRKPRSKAAGPAPVSLRLRCLDPCTSCRTGLRCGSAAPRCTSSSWAARTRAAIADGVFLPKERILFMSEAYLHRVFPAMRSAFPTEWVATIERAQVMPVNTFVPGHGFVDPPAILKEELDTFRQALRTVIAEGKRLHAAGIAVDEAVTQARFGDLEGWTLRSGQVRP